MKITFLGTGTMGSSRKNTAFVIDDHILVEIGNGVLNALRDNSLDVENIDTLVITHFHCDHFADIINFFIRRKRPNGANKHLTIIAPIEAKQKIINLYNLFFEKDTDRKITEYTFEAITPNTSIIELGNNEVYENKKITIKAFAVNHGAKPNCNGYLLTVDKTAIGYTGDTAICDSLLTNIKNADTWIMEASSLTQPKEGHTGLDEIENIASENLQKTFYVVHRRDYETSFNYSNKNIILPKDNQTFMVGSGNVAIYDKLVRDKIPEIIKAKDNQKPKTHTLNDNDFNKELNLKLREEVTEYLTDESLEELADILEVIHGLLLAKNKTFAELEQIRIAKKNKRGGFEKRVFLENVKK